MGICIGIIIFVDWGLPLNVLEDNVMDFSTAQFARNLLRDIVAFRIFSSQHDVDVEDVDYRYTQICQDMSYVGSEIKTHEDYVEILALHAVAKRFGFNTSDLEVDMAYGQQQLIQRYNSRYDYEFAIEERDKQIEQRNASLFVAYELTCLALK